MAGSTIQKPAYTYIYTQRDLITYLRHILNKYSCIWLAPNLVSKQQQQQQTFQINEHLYLYVHLRHLININTFSINEKI